MIIFKTYLYWTLSVGGIFFLVFLTLYHFKNFLLRSNCSPFPIGPSIIGFLVSKWIGFDSYIWLVGILLENIVAQLTLFPFISYLMSHFTFMKEERLYLNESRPEGRTNQLIVHKKRNGTIVIDYSGNGTKLKLTDFEMPIDLMNLKWRYIRIDYTDRNRGSNQIIPISDIFDISIYH